MLLGLRVAMVVSSLKLVLLLLELELRLLQMVGAMVFVLLVFRTSLIEGFVNHFFIIQTVDIFIRVRDQMLFSHVEVAEFRLKQFHVN